MNPQIFLGLITIFLFAENFAVAQSRYSDEGRFDGQERRTNNQGNQNSPREEIAICPFNQVKMGANGIRQIELRNSAMDLLQSMQKSCLDFLYRANPNQRMDQNGIPLTDKKPEDLFSNAVKRFVYAANQIPDRNVGPEGYSCDQLPLLKQVIDAQAELARTVVGQVATRNQQGAADAQETPFERIFNRCPDVACIDRTALTLYSQKLSFCQGQQDRHIYSSMIDSATSPLVEAQMAFTQLVQNIPAECRSNINVSTSILKMADQLLLDTAQAPLMGASVGLLAGFSAQIVKVLLDQAHQNQLQSALLRTFRLEKIDSISCIMMELQNNFLGCDSLSAKTEYASMNSIPFACEMPKEHFGRDLSLISQKLINALKSSAAPGKTEQELIRLADSPSIPDGQGGKINLKNYLKNLSLRLEKANAPKHVREQINRVSSMLDQIVGDKLAAQKSLLSIQAGYTDEELKKERAETIAKALKSLNASDVLLYAISAGIESLKTQGDPGEADEQIQNAVMQLFLEKEYFDKMLKLRMRANQSGEEVAAAARTLEILTNAFGSTFDEHLKNLSTSYQETQRCAQKDDERWRFTAFNTVALPLIKQCLLLGATYHMRSGNFSNSSAVNLSSNTNYEQACAPLMCFVPEAQRLDISKLSQVQNFQCSLQPTKGYAKIIAEYQEHFLKNGTLCPGEAYQSATYMQSIQALLQALPFIGSYMCK